MYHEKPINSYVYIFANLFFMILSIAVSTEGSCILILYEILFKNYASQENVI